MKTEKESKPVILMIGPLEPPIGGMATSIKNLAASYLKDKYDICLFDITGYRTRKKANILYGIFYQIYLLFILAYILAVKKPKISHIHLKGGFYFYRRCADILLCRLLCRKILLHIRGGDFKDFYINGSFATKGMVKFILSISDQIITLTNSWQGFISTIVDGEKVRVVPNGVVISDFKLGTDMKKQSARSEDTIFVIFIGRIEEAKGAFDILGAIPEVVKRVNNIIFIFLGPDSKEGGGIERFNNIVNAKGLKDYIKYPKETTGQEKIDCLLSSDIFLFPSHRENLPNVMLEAMAAGLPVIISDVGGIKDVVQDGVNGFIIKAGDINAIAGKIIIMVNDEQLRKRMGRANLELAKEKYDMPIIAGMIDEVYQGLLK